MKSPDEMLREKLMEAVGRMSLQELELVLAFISRMGEERKSIP